MRVEEEGKPRRELVHVHAPRHSPLDIGEAVRERERKLLRRRRARLADVVAGDRDRMPLRELRRTPLHHVRNQPHRRLGREDVLLLRDVLLEDVRLDRPPQRRRRHPLLLTHRDVEREQDRRRRIDRHRGRDVAERDSAEERLHVLERVDRHTFPADFAQRALVVRVVAHQRRHVESSRETRLAVLEQVPEALVRLFRGPKTRELPHRPQLPAIHRRIHTPRKRMHTRIAEVPLVVELDRVRRRQRHVLQPRNRREQLTPPLRRPPVQLLTPRLSRVQGAAILGRRHRSSL